MALLRGPPEGGIWVLYQDLISPMGMRTVSERGCSKVVFYRSGDETGGLDLTERRKSL